MIDTERTRAQRLREAYEELNGCPPPDDLVVRFLQLVDIQKRSGLDVFLFLELYYDRTLQERDRHLNVFLKALKESERSFKSAIPSGEQAAHNIGAVIGLKQSVDRVSSMYADMIKLALFMVAGAIILTAAIIAATLHLGISIGNAESNSVVRATYNQYACRVLAPLRHTAIVTNNPRMRSVINTDAERYNCGD